MPQFSIVIFGYDVTGYITFLIGIVITAILNYWLLSKREKKQLKVKIQIETAEALQEKIKEFIDVSHKVKNLDLCFVYIKHYNNDFNNKDSDGLEEFYKKLMNDDIKRIRDKFIEWDNDYFNYYSKAYFSIQFFIEMRQVVLIRFQNFHTELANSYDRLLEKKGQLDNYKNEVVTMLIESKHIDEEIINKFQDEYNIFKEILYDIDSYLLDLQIGLQNVFYKKLFKTKIPIRKPNDPNMKVITPKKNKVKFIS